MSQNLMIGVCAIAAIAAGCGRSVTYTSKDGSVTVQQKGKDAGLMTFTGKNGEKLEINTAGGKMPDDYPKDMPVYGEAKVVMSQSASEKHTATLMLESSDPTDKIVDFYKKGLESNGWKIEGSVNTAELNMFTATKENRQALVQIMHDNSKTTINQVLSDKQ